MSDTAATRLSTLQAAAAGEGVEPAFQPIVSLPDEALVGYEALARWPTLDDPEPGNVFAHAAAAGTVDRLDRMCITAAIDAALRNGLKGGSLLLVNCEPTSAYVSRFDNEVVARGYDELDVTFELTERGLLARPQALLRKVAGLRSEGFTIALDDVGAEPDSLALLDVIRPDLVKLDVSLVQSQPRDDQARTLAGVLAHRERTGATILAEGIETDEHVEQALALGASLGQGFKFGRAGVVRGRAPVRYTLSALQRGQQLSSNSPFELAARSAPVRTANKATLTAFSHHIESQASHAADPPMLLTALQRREFFSARTRQRYREMAPSLPLVAIFGADVPTQLDAHIRGVQLDPLDPLCAEWVVVALGPHTAAALLAREHDQASGRRVLDSDRRFDFTITYDRSLVTQAARTLLERMR